MGKDPLEFWYQDELGFFDNYVIPVAKNLKTAMSLVFRVMNASTLCFTKLQGVGDVRKRGFGRTQRTGGVKAPLSTRD